MTEPEILYEDTDIVVAVKPAGMASQPDRSLGMDMLNWLRNRAAHGSKGQTPDIYVVHRLDRPVGGVMVYAKNSRAAGALSEQVRCGAVYKEYAAVLTGIPGTRRDDSSDMITMVDYIVPGKGRNLTRVISDGRVHGVKKAVLEYRILAVKDMEAEDAADNGAELSLAQIHLITGRRHQIRAQMAHAGAGIWGDMKYNPIFAGRHGHFSLALFAWRLEICLPSSGKRVSFMAEMPAAISDHFPDSDRLFTQAACGAHKIIL